jgi:hypothetical protein
MDRAKKIELIQRSLGLRHKLKVHETMEPPATHEDLAVMLHSKWEFEDELHAIEELLGEERQRRVAERKAEYAKEIKESGNGEDTKKKSKK